MISVSKYRNILFEKSPEEIWNLKIDNNSIYFDTIYNNKIKTVEIASEIIDFDAILYGNELHLIYLSSKGYLCHMKYDNGNWKETPLKFYNPSTDKIEYIKIIEFQGKLNVFYSFKNILKRDYNTNKLYIIHLYYDSGAWIYKYLDAIYDVNKKIKLFIHNNSNKELLYFTSIESNNKLELYCKFISNIKSHWRNKGQINMGNKIAKIHNIYIDSRTIHIIYKNRDDIRFSYYTYKDINDLSMDIKYKYQINCDEYEDLEYSMFKTNGTLYVAWIKENKIYYRTNTSGNWSEINKIDLDNIFRIKILGNSFKDTNINKGEIISLGTIDKYRINFIGLKQTLEEEKKEDEEKIPMVKTDEEVGVNKETADLEITQEMDKESNQNNVDKGKDKRILKKLIDFLN